MMQILLTIFIILLIIIVPYYLGKIVKYFDKKNEITLIYSIPDYMAGILTILISTMIIVIIAIIYIIAGSFLT